MQECSFADEDVCVPRVLPKCFCPSSHSPVAPCESRFQNHFALSHVATGGVKSGQGWRRVSFFVVGDGAAHHDVAVVAGQPVAVGVVGVVVMDTLTVPVAGGEGSL